MIYFLLEITIWGVLSAIAPVLAPVLSLVIVGLVKIIWNLHQRINSLEEGNTRQSRTLYGDEKDSQQEGLSEDLNKFEERIADLEERVADLERRVNRIAEQVKNLLPD